MKLFKAVTTVQGTKEPFVDWYESKTESEARKAWDEDCHRYQLPMEKVSVQFIECDPRTREPITQR